MGIPVVSLARLMVMFFMSQEKGSPSGSMKAMLLSSSIDPSVHGLLEIKHEASYVLSGYVFYITSAVPVAHPIFVFFVCF